MGTLTNPKAMLLFCEALKYSNNLLRLCVGNCGIDNRLLQGLASAITEGCRVQTLYIENNPYTAAGLSQFLQTLVFGVEYTFLAVLSVDTDSFQRTYHSLIEQFNFKHRKSVVWHTFPVELRLECANSWVEVLLNK